MQQKNDFKPIQKHSVFNTIFNAMTTRRHIVIALWASLLSLAMPQTTHAQSIEGTDYYLPKAVMRFTVKVEKTQYQPGKFANYARRYIKKDVAMEPATSYRLIGLDMNQLAMPDTAKHFTLIVDKKHSINKVSRADNGQLLAINGEAQALPEPLPSFTPAPKPAPLNPHDFMTAEILNATNSAKMAELSAREIYDIRESRNLLNRGEADNLPKDGAQLRIMLANLDRQETALSQLFEGTTEKDTTWTTIDFTPTEVGQQVLFRFSKRLGLLDNDDLGGAPYYIIVTDNHTVAAPKPAEPNKKEDKNDIGLRVSQPGSINVSITNGTKQLYNYQLQAPQFGVVESISGELFGRKQSSRLILNPLTGSLQSIEAIAAE